MPGKHLLIETEDDGEDSGGVTENKSKILDYHTSLHSTILCRLNGKQEFEVEAALFSREEFHSALLFSLLR